MRGVKFYGADVPAVNQLGVPVAHVLQADGPASTPSSTDDRVRITLLMDAQYRIVEIDVLNYVTQFEQAREFMVAVLDVGGNYFQDRYYGPKSSGEPLFQSHQKFVAADGTRTYQQDLNPRRPEKGTEHVLTRIYQIATRKNWDSFLLVPTYAWFGGLYRFGAKYQSAPPTNRQWLYVDSVEGQDVCAEGSVGRDESWTSYPSPTATAGFCINDW